MRGLTRMALEFTLDRSRDALLRDTGFQLKTGTTVENSAIYAYSPTDGRLATVGSAAVPPPVFSYSYLPNSNLLASTTGPIHTVTNVWEPTRDVLDLKQNKVGTTVISNYDYAVDAIGQRTGVTTSGTAFPAIPSWLWSYDALGQVIAADSSFATSDRSYQYDTIGNRQKSADSVVLPVANNYTTNALNQYSAIQQGGTGVSPVLTLKKTRLWGTDLSGTPQGAGGVAGLLSESINNPLSTINYFPTYDGNGNISEYLTATGTIAAHFEYDPFGNTVVNTDTSNLFTYRFSTKPRDVETGLYYYGYRYYDPLSGKWSNRDPIVEKGGMNLYGMFGNYGIDRACPRICDFGSDFYQLFI